MARNDPALPPDPDGGWSYSVKPFPDALVVPHDRPGPELKCGVFSAAGEYIPRAAMWKRGVPITVAPDTVPDFGERLAGDWLWGGVLYGHFGHFITESLARLWAAPDLRAQLQGVVFVEKYPSGDAGPPDYIRDLIRLSIGDLPLHFVTRPTRVDCLHVAGPGFGLGDMARGTRVFRRFIARDFARGIAPDGPENLFITRSQLPPGRGEGFVGEALFDDRFARAGYQVFCPERHGIATQVAHYRAARRIVGIDGSAFHLVGLVAQADQTIGVIARRQRTRSRSMRLQIQAFSGVAPHIIDTLRPQPGDPPSIRDFDLEAMGRRLKKSGLLAADTDWGPLSAEEDAVLDSMAGPEAHRQEPEPESLSNRAGH